MKDELISFETAKLAKEKGFNIVCTMQYTDFNGIERLQNYIDVESETFPYAPTQSLLQKWLREVHNIHISTIIRVGTRKYRVRIDYKHLEIWKNEICGIFNTYEEALEKGLQEALIQKIP
jgi:hypothetical protein